MIEKIISLICEELGYDDDAITENTELNELVEDGVELDEIIRIIEGEFYVDLSEELSGDVTIGQVAGMLE
ncbi:MAG: acyl carrier protein [Ruminococcaceae bacterium]|nr:acyl carrier protein [Oscillospiraceae bacterium]